jgi:hypothetical protein
MCGKRAGLSVSRRRHMAGIRAHRSGVGAPRHESNHDLGVERVGGREPARTGRNWSGSAACAAACRGGCRRDPPPRPASGPRAQGGCRAAR